MADRTPFGRFEIDSAPQEGAESQFVDVLHRGFQNIDKLRGIKPRVSAYRVAYVNGEKPEFPYGVADELGDVLASFNPNCTGLDEIGDVFLLASKISGMCGFPT